MGLAVPIIEVDLAEAGKSFPKGSSGRADGVPRGWARLAGRHLPTRREPLRRSTRRSEAVRRGVAAAVVTNPIAKHVLYAAGFAHPGHTEYLGELARIGIGTARCAPVMMLWSEELAVVPVTIHVALAARPRAA